MLTVIIPAYNEADNILITSETICQILEDNQIEYELIFIDDGSKDDTFEKIKCANQLMQNIKGYKFSRNFGKEMAISAGLNFSKGECCAVLDCDLQHPPEILVDMYNKWLEGYKIIEGIKVNRGKEPVIYKFFSKIFYNIIYKLTKLDLCNSSDFKLLDRQVVDIIKKMPERRPFFRAMSFWCGFKSTKMEYEVKERKYGMTKWNFQGLFRYALSNITSFSSAPLQIVTILGVIFMILSAYLGSVTLYKYFMGAAVEGFSTVILLLLIMGGALMTSLGTIGYYIGKIYDEIKLRPKYIIEDQINA
ncbi:glycosyltransferase family 2 protein [Aminipila terrae]|uniref:Glycosyltransferase n=1 Tax=Aminipila terrae TaxID=2697030 RepID=A0A6P1MDF8_9FIRM|nr:glycosyltransferase family 2 protein [Aminipila terrae]QHI72052.1 glycosyltransferase [Aminipila terrae]